MSLRQAWISYAAGLVGLFLLLFHFGCIPKVCYHTGLDGLEPLREFSLFLTEGLSLLGAAATEKGLSKSEVTLANGSAFYAIAYYPVTFTIAGVRLVPQFSPVPVLAILTLLSLATTARIRSIGASRIVSLGIPILSYLLLTVVSLGISSQYYAQIVPLLGVFALCVSFAAVLGVLNLGGPWETICGIAGSKPLTVGLVGFVLVVMVVVTPDAVSGTSPDLRNGSYSFQNPVLVAGFNSGPNVGTGGVSANFSFAGTDPTSIQTNNYLAAGLGVHSPNCCVDGIDYGYRADVFLYHNGSEVFAASGWEACDIITACGGHTWRQLIFFSSSKVNSSIDANFRITMEWKNQTLVWSYASGNENVALATLQDPRQDNTAFDAGWLGTTPNPSPGGYPFFQFGILSAFPVDHPGWRVEVSCPSMLMNLKWQCLDHAGLVQGDNSYWKFIWRWGENYPGVGATTSVSAKTIILQPAQQSVQDFQVAW